MDHFTDERDFKSLENDKYTFFVLRRIIGGECELLLTDHERLIICLSCHPFPVWIWTPDNASEAEMERAYRIALEHDLLNGKHRINMKYELADYFMKRTRIEGREGYRRDAELYINSGKMFFWKNTHGQNVACCKYGPNDSLASINLVFTRPEFRRMHYAENLVYEVTQLAKMDGYVPMLYTDADYIASNACYEKIGYVLRGKLCTIG